MRIGSYELVTHCACFVLPYLAEGRAGLLPLQRLDLDIRNSSQMIQLSIEYRVVSWHLAGRAASETSTYSVGITSKR